MDAAGRATTPRLPALYAEHVLQANEGCDLDFLRGRSAVMTSAATYH